jgi:hypothetical protein
METIKVSITLPVEVAEILSKVPDKSKFVAEAIKEYHLKKQKKVLFQKLKEGYIRSKTEDKEICKEWETTTGDGV